MLRLLILGASGRTGAPVLERARYAGHQVSVMVRDPHAFGEVQQVRVIKGDVTSKEDLQRAVEGQQAVINMIGSRSRRHPIEATVTKLLVPAAVKAEVNRLMVCSTYGVNDTAIDAPWPSKIKMRTLQRKAFADREEADAMVRACPLDWTLVYPTRLTDDPPVGDFQAVEKFTPRGAARISRVDVARFMVDQLMSKAWSRRTVILSNHH